MSRRAHPVILSQAEQQCLEQLTRRRRSARSLAFRARLILACAQGKSNREVAAQMRCCNHTVGGWRRRFLARRVDGLLDEPRPGAGRKIGDAQIEAVITATLESTPQAATHWSTRLMARKMGLQGVLTREARVIRFGFLMPFFAKFLAGIWPIPARNLAKNGAKILCGWRAPLVSTLSRASSVNRP